MVLRENKQSRHPTGPSVFKKRVGGEKTRINSIKEKYGNITTDTTTIQGIIRKYYKKLYANKSEDFQEMNRFLDTYHLSKLSHEVTENLNKSITKTEIESVIKSLTTGPER